ncbi:SGNH/GDSL hydrolase family protein [Amycolatopsis regifaucium]|uniref:GDSL family lipase n=1 Tax=Amycolatopsis regifaucium TaxID=546365 RepID=A0A154MW87_9PSEU|nr:SGNH/GDSL hydrolase family protein [Amycolatopsis regifaucium]KZB88561.1 GDSL family lipase [Amycolatopsis regifaucium]OKA07268.1 GDSL family lipase [Amycolatopsis regifaucium]SFI51220.1 Lysophospholipase L1 [Amycolatopsis regifaucium]
MRFTGTDRLLFAGDSITDSGRDRTDPASLGKGYVRQIADRLPGGPVVLNKGLNGNRIYDLEARWTTDVLAERPTVLTVKIGINDTWRTFDRGLPSPIGKFRAAYRRLLGSARQHLPAELYVITPFLLPVEPEQHEWLGDLAPRIEVALEVAAEFGARPVRADLFMPKAAEEHGAATLAPDGVHPSPLGHRLLAEAWLATAGAPIEEVHRP